ncbi:MAG: methyltransferase [Duncaniella sp.]|nr:methyltransferase [Duncaniella sp.]
MSFSFKKFTVDDSRCGMKVGTDGVLVGAWCGMTGDAMPQNVLDIGAGSGLISLMTAQRFPEAKVTGIEIAPDACADARNNIDKSPWHDRVTVIEGDITDVAQRPEGRWDLIVSNPPFFSETLHAPDAARATARHGETFDVTQLISLAPQLLTPNGSLCFIAPSARDGEIDFLAELARLHTTAVTRVYSKTGSRTPIRTLRRLSMTASPCVSEDLVIRRSDGGYSADYVSLTKDFYLHL